MSCVRCAGWWVLESAGQCHRRLPPLCRKRRHTHALSYTPHTLTHRNTHTEPDPATRAASDSRKRRPATEIGRHKNKASNGFIHSSDVVDGVFRFAVLLPGWVTHKLVTAYPSPRRHAHKRCALSTTDKGTVGHLTNPPATLGPSAGSSFAEFLPGCFEFFSSLLSVLVNVCVHHIQRPSAEI